MPVHVNADRLVSFVLNRAGREFSERECAIFDALRFQLGAEYMAQETRLLAQRTLAQLNELLLASGTAVIVLDRSRQVLRSSASALKCLSCAGLGGGVRLGERLPEPVDRWLRARLAPSWATSMPAR